MSSDDLKSHATASHDFYSLLGLENESSSTAAINRAYRQSSLKYHPDKNPDSPELIEKFHLIGIARDVLLDPEAKALHDKTLNARKQKQRANELLEGRRRTMMEDLEQRESGAFKRKRDVEDEEEKKERELRALAEDGKRRRREMEEKARKQEEASAQANMSTSTTAAAGVSATTFPNGTDTPQASEADRRVFVRILRDIPSGSNITEPALAEMFSRFGRVEVAYILKEKKLRLHGEKHKKLVATAAITFVSGFSAAAALEGGKKLSDAFLDITPGPGSSHTAPSATISDEDVTAAKQPTPASGNTGTHTGTPSTPLKSSLSKSFRASISSMDGLGLGAPPSFSFSPMSAKSPANNEEATLLRLKAAQKAAEKRRLEEQIRREEAASAAVE